MSTGAEAPTVLRIYFSCRPVPGGMEGHITELTRLQRGSGWRVLHLFAAGEVGHSDDIRIPGLAWTIRIRPQALRDVLFFLSAMILLAKRRIRADVVHVHGDWSAILLGRLVAWVVTAPALMAAIHGRIERAGFPLSVFRFAIRRCDAVYATGFSEARLLKQLGVRRSEWITSGYHPETFFGRADESRPVDVLGVGSLVPVKNFGLFLDIATRLPEYSFSLVGGGPLQGFLSERIEREKLENVCLTGPLGAVDVAEQMRAAKILLVTSIAEGTPTVAIEAMACGAVVVSTAANELDSLLPSPECGEVVRAATAERIAQVLRSRLGDATAMRRGAERNMTLALSYGWAEVCAKVNALTIAAVRGDESRRADR